MVTQITSYGAGINVPGITVRETSAPNLSTNQGFGTVAVYASLKRGPMGVPIPVDNREAYAELFGKPGDPVWHLFKDGSNLAPDAIDGIFSQSGGTRVWVVRNELDGKARAASVTLNSRVTGVPVLKISAANGGRWGGYDRSLPTSSVTLATTRTFTISAPNVRINEFVGAEAVFSRGSGQTYKIIGNSPSNPENDEVVFTVSSQYNLTQDGITGATTLGGTARYIKRTNLTGTVEVPLYKEFTGGTVYNTGNKALTTSLLTDDLDFNAILKVGDTVIVDAGGPNQQIREVVEIKSGKHLKVDRSWDSEFYKTKDEEGNVTEDNSLSLFTYNKTVTGTGTDFSNELEEGDTFYVGFTVDGTPKGYSAKVESIVSATELELVSEMAEAVPAGTIAKIDNYKIEVDPLADEYGNTIPLNLEDEVNIGDYIVDPNPNVDSARQVVAIDTTASPQTITVDDVFSQDFDVSVTIQAVDVKIDMIAPPGQGLEVEIGQGVKFPNTHFSFKVYFENSLVFSADDVSLDPEDSLYVEREINQGNIGYKAGDKEFQTWITAEVLNSDVYTTSENNDVRPANGSGTIMAIDNEEKRLYTLESHPQSVVGSLFYPSPYEVARLSYRVSAFMPAQKLTAGVVTIGIEDRDTINGTTATFTQDLSQGDLVYIRELDIVRTVNEVIDDTTVSFTEDLVGATETAPSKISLIKAGYFTFNPGINLNDYATVGKRYLAVFKERLIRGYDGDTNTIPYHWTRYFDLDTNQLEDAVFGLNQGLIRIIVPGISDVSVQKAAAYYASQKGFEFRGEIPSYVNSEALAESFLNNELGRNNALTLAFPSYGNIPSPFSRGSRFVPITGDLLGMESRYALNYQGYHHPAAGTDAILSRVASLPVTLNRKGQEILNSAGIQQIFELDGNIIVFGNRSPALDDIYTLMHVRRTQSAYVRYFIEARALMQVLFKPNQPETVEQVLLFLNTFAAQEYRKGVYTNFLSMEDTVSVETSPERAGNRSNKDIILSVVKGELYLKYSYLPAGVVEKVVIDVGPSQIVSAYASA